MSHRTNALRSGAGLFEQRLNDPDRMPLATRSAIAAAQAEGRESVTPDDLLEGLLRAIARFGVVWLGVRPLDLEALGIGGERQRSPGRSGPAYAPETAELFDRAAALAREDAAGRMAPIHLLASYRDASASALLARVLAALGTDETGWRAALARCAWVPDESVSLSSPGGSRFRDLLSPDEAAEVLGVHTQTLRGYIRSGKLDAYRLAGERAIRIRRQDLLGLLEEMDPGASAQGSN